MQSDMAYIRINKDKIKSNNTRSTKIIYRTRTNSDKQKFPCYCKFVLTHIISIMFCQLRDIYRARPTSESNVSTRTKRKYECKVDTRACYGKILSIMKYFKKLNTTAYYSNISNIEASSNLNIRYYTTLVGIAVILPDESALSIGRESANEQTEEVRTAIRRK